MECVDLAKDRNKWWAVVEDVMNIWVPRNAEDLLARSGNVSFSRNTLLH